MKPILYLAPIKGITDAVYRNTFSKYFDGFDIAIAPFILATQTNRIKPSHLKDLLTENNSGMSIVPQIMSNNPEHFILLARYIFELGYENINWNLGCPYPMVVKKKRGAGLLPHADMVESFLEKSLPSIPNKLSIKTRLGYNRADEIIPLLAIFNQYPLTEIIIHPRTGKQMFEGNTDPDAFEKCLFLSEHPLVYSGDIKDHGAFMALSRRFKEIDRWMIGRGTIANPFLPAIIKRGNDTFSNKIEKIKLFHDALFDQYRQILSGPSHIVERMKGFWFYFSQSFKNGKNILKKIQKTKRDDKYLEVVNHFFDEEAEWIA